MKLFIHLKNPQQDAVSIKEALKCFDSAVIIEDEKIMITTSSLVVGDVDLSDNNVVWDIWDRVKEFIDIINGSAIVEGVSMGHVALENITYEDRSGQIKNLTNACKMYAVLPSIRGGKPDISKLIPLALKDNAVAKALRLCSRDLDWVNLYRIYEVVKEDMGGLSSDELKIFKGMANNSSVSGDHARHGKMKAGTPEKTMHLADAQHLIKRTLREWIYSKLNSGPRNI